MIRILKISPLVAAMLLMLPVSSIAGDGRDKALHFGISAAFGGISETFFHHKTNLSPVKRIAASTMIGSVPGLIKEVYDGSRSDNVFSATDMAANAAGAFSGSILARISHKGS